MQRRSTTVLTKGWQYNDDEVVENADGGGGDGDGHPYSAWVAGWWFWDMVLVRYNNKHSDSESWEIMFLNKIKNVQQAFLNYSESLERQFKCS